MAGALATEPKRESQFPAQPQPSAQGCYARGEKPQVHDHQQRGMVSAEYALRVYPVLLGEEIGCGTPATDSTPTEWQRGTVREA